MTKIGDFDVLGKIGNDYLYLAHPRESRKKVRRWQLDFEKRKGIKFLNPFYEIDREHKEMDINEENPLKVYAVLDDNTVKEELDLLKGGNGVVSKVDGALSYGTIQEMVYSRLFGKPLFSLITNGQENNPWLRYHSTKIFTELNELENFLEKVKDNNFYVPKKKLENEVMTEVLESIEEIKKLDIFCAKIGERLDDYKTLQSMVYAHIFGKDVYSLITNGHEHHPWIRYHSTRVFTDGNKLDIAIGRYGNKRRK